MEVINEYLTNGFSYPLEHWQQWATEIVTKDNGFEQRNQLWSSPVRHWVINLLLMENSDRQEILQLFGRAAGKYRIFLLEHNFGNSQDNLCELTDWSYTAVGGETTTQLQKTYSKGETEEWTENKTRIVPGTIYAPTIKIDGATKTEDTHFTLDDDMGIIDWTGGSSPVGSLGAGKIVTADYKFYYPVRFNEDIYKDSMDFYNLWNLRSLELIQVKE